jgi:hypothetical protein
MSIRFRERFCEPTWANAASFEPLGESVYTARTMKPLLLDQALSRRIELAEAKAAAASAEAMRKERPTIGASVEQIAGGYAVYGGANSPVTQTVGIGLRGEVTRDEFGRIESFYRSRNEPVRVETSPLADSSLFKLFGANDYEVTEFTNVMARAVSQEEELPPANEKINVGRVSCGELGLWTRTVSQGFAGDAPLNPEILDLMEMFAHADGLECYLARIDDEPAGAGTLAIRDGVAGLFGASTLVPFRNRGVQGGLLAARLRRAAEAGCDLAVCLSQPGSSSQRNIVRQGFETLYTRVKFERHWR